MSAVTDGAKSVPEPWKFSENNTGLHFVLIYGFMHLGDFREWLNIYLKRLNA